MPFGRVTLCHDAWPSARRAISINIGASRASADCRSCIHLRTTKLLRDLSHEDGHTRRGRTAGQTGPWIEVHLKYISWISSCVSMERSIVDNRNQGWVSVGRPWRRWLAQVAGFARRASINIGPWAIVTQADMIQARAHRAWSFNAPRARINIEKTRVRPCSYHTKQSTNKTNTVHTSFSLDDWTREGLIYNNLASHQQLPLAPSLPFIPHFSSSPPQLDSKCPT